jgi:predicted nucleic acid-binding Zn ribbon protein
VKRQGPRAVGDLLVTAVPELRDRLVEARLRAAWSTVVGADAARRSRPQSLSNGCLHVIVDNSPWLQELTLRSGELTTLIAARFETIRTLRFTLGRLDGASETPPAPESRAPRALNSDDVREIDATVAPIRDPDVRAAARRLLGTARRLGPQRGAV